MDYIRQRFITNGCVMSFLITIFYFLLLNYSGAYFLELSILDCVAIAIVLGFINFISVAFEFRHSNLLTRKLMELSEIIKWASIMYLLLVVAISICNFLIFEIPIFYRRLTLLIIVLLFIYSYYNAHHLSIVERDIFVDNLAEEITIFHLSDIHVGSIRRPSLLVDVVQKINEKNPDLVIISGDLADGTCEIKEDDFMAFAKSNSPVIFTPGNHDYYVGIENIFKAARNAGITILNNSKTKFKDLNIYGIPFSFFNTDMEEFNLNKSENNLLIYHVPSYWDEFAEKGFNIQLSGHTHGGQFYPMNFIVKLLFPYLRGLFEKKGNYLIVSDGIGTMGPPLRCGTKSEIAYIKIKPKN